MVYLLHIFRHHCYFDAAVGLQHIFCNLLYVLRSNSVQKVFITRVEVYAVSQIVVNNIVPIVVCDSILLVCFQ